MCWHRYKSLISMVSAIIGTVHAVYCDQTFDAPLDLVGSSN